MLLNPRFLLAVIAALLALAVQSGELGTSDTGHRLQAAHALWTGEPPVFPNEYPEFGIHGRDGKLQSWYGIGQSLLMLPFDVVGSELERLPIFADYNGNDPSVRDIVVSACTSVLLTVATALLCFRFLLQLGYRQNHAVAGVLALLFSTTHLHYTQNLMENNLIFLLTLAGFSFGLQWLRTGSRLALLVGACALGFNLLTRLTTGLDLLAVSIFLALVQWFEAPTRPAFRARLRSYFTYAIPTYALFLVLDRVYQFYRFGSFTNTYLSIVATEARQRDPSLPVNYPFELSFHAGFFGALFSPEKSIFLFDPLLILMFLVGIAGWRRFAPAVRAYVLASALLLLAYISFYARYTVWSGDSAWGDRYVSTGAEFAALLAVPLLLQQGLTLGKSLWRMGIAILIFSTAIQVASLAFWLPLEIYQMETLGQPTFVIALRFKNIAAFILGKRDAWGLTNAGMMSDAWDYVHMDTWNFLPFLLRRSGQSPAWAVNAILFLWIALVAALIFFLWRILFLLSGEPAAADTL